MSKQLLRSGTAIGALIREAQGAESKMDFLHKMSIAKKEAEETDYWLALLHAAKYVEPTLFLSLQQEIAEILKILGKIISTTRQSD